jgi:hypothetical protein
VRLHALDAQGMDKPKNGESATACASPAARVARFAARPAKPASPLHRGRFAVAGPRR